MQHNRIWDSRRDRVMARAVDAGIALQASVGLPKAYRFFLRWQVPQPVLRRVMAQPASRRAPPPT